MDEIEIRLAELDMAGRFPRNAVGRALARQAIEWWKATKDAISLEAADRAASAASGYANHVFHSSAFFRDGDMSEWYSLPSLGIEELAHRRDELLAAWTKAQSLLNEDDEYAAEAEQERIDRLEDEGAYGRTHAWTPDCERWIYLRFGALPKDGRSRFGLAREDTEDGPDPWRMELGMTHEAGICVFRAYRHPDAPGAYVLLAPDFSKARYGVSGQEAHLLAVVPDPGSLDGIEAFRIDGSPVTSKAPDGTLRCELGSDGEYLLDARKPFEVRSIRLEDIWVSETVRLDDLLRSRRGYEVSPSLWPGA